MVQYAPHKIIIKLTYRTLISEILLNLVIETLDNHLRLEKYISII